VIHGQMAMTIALERWCSEQKQLAAALKKNKKHAK
jgi:hypothetical protein